MHRFYVDLHTQDQWYSVIREANQWFGHKGWKGQNNVRRKLTQNQYTPTINRTVRVWFEVPDLKFATWLGIKYSINAEISTDK